MPRPLRIEFPGALYHVTARGERREDIFVDDADRARLLAVVAQAIRGAIAVVLPDEQSLPLRGSYRVSQAVLADAAYQRRVLPSIQPATWQGGPPVPRPVQGHFGRQGGLFAGGMPLLEFNPVRARMVAAPGEWAWSSYRAHVGQSAGAPWLDTPGLHGFLSGKYVESAEDMQRAQRLYAELVALGQGVALWDEALNRQIYLGDDDFVRRMLDAAAPQV